MIDLHLFYNGPESPALAVAGGIDALIVDCETLGKRERQRGYDTEINLWQPRDCEQVRIAAPTLRVICRLDSFRTVGSKVLDQAHVAVLAGAHEVILPMVDTIDEVRSLLDAIAGRAEVGVMIETEGAIAIVDQLDNLPLRRAFFGLNDLMIERRSRHLFEGVLDGSVERLRPHCRRLAFGFGGMTLPEGGHPVPSRLMIAELARMRCDFTFLRRSFYRDVVAAGLDPAASVARMRRAWTAARARPEAAVAADHAELRAILERVVQGVKAGAE
ncbi:MAG: aldolase [Steroidobacteraceae bacterium]